MTMPELLTEHERRVMTDRTQDPERLGMIGSVTTKDGKTLNNLPILFDTKEQKLRLALGAYALLKQQCGMSFSNADIESINYPETGHSNCRPSVVQVEMTTRCNLSCVFCAGRKFAQESMSLSAFETILGRFDYMLDEIILQGEGEPFLHKDIFDMILLARQKARTVSSISNGHLLHRTGQYILDAGLDELGFSVESIDPEKFARIRRNGNFSLFDRNVRSFHQLKGVSDPRTVLYVSVLRDTLREIPNILEWAQAVGFDRVTIQSLQEKQSYRAHYDAELLANAVSQKEVLTFVRQFRTQYGDTILKRFFDKREARGLACPIAREGIYVLVNGDVTPCCFIKQDRQERSFGNLLQHSLAEVLKSEARSGFRNKLFRGGIPHDCEGCSLSEPEGTYWR